MQDKKKVPVKQQIIPQIMEFLRLRKLPIKTYDIAKHFNCKTSAEINPTLYAMQRKRLISKVGQSPVSWKLGQADETFMESDNEWNDIETSAEEKLRLLRLVSCQSSSGSEPFPSFRSNYSEQPSLNSEQSLHFIDNRNHLSDTGFSESNTDIEEGQNSLCSNTPTVKKEIMDQEVPYFSEEDTVLKALWKCPNQMASEFVIGKHLENPSFSNGKLKIVLEGLKQKHFVDIVGSAWIMKPKGIEYLKETYDMTLKENIQRSEKIGKASIMRRGTGPPPPPRELLEHQQNLACGVTVPSSVLSGRQNPMPLQSSETSVSLMESQEYGKDIRTPVPLMSLKTTGTYSFQSQPSKGSFSSPSPLMSVDTTASKFSKFQQPFTNTSQATSLMGMNAGQSPLLSTLSVISRFQSNPLPQQFGNVNVRPSLLTIRNSIRGSTPFNMTQQEIASDQRCSTNVTPASTSTAHVHGQQSFNSGNSSRVTVADKLNHQFSMPPPSLLTPCSTSSNLVNSTGTNLAVATVSTGKNQSQASTGFKPPLSPAELVKLEKNAGEDVNIAEAAAVGINVLLKNPGQMKTPRSTSNENGKFFYFFKKNLYWILFTYSLNR